MSFELTKGQSETLDKIMTFLHPENNVYAMIVEGYAGTGKTWLIAKALKLAFEQDILNASTKANLACWNDDDDDKAVAVCAPTNKAVGVLHTKINEFSAILERDIKFCSIHSLLGLKMIEKDDGTQECKPDGESSIGDYRIVVIDEASMLGKDMFSKIMLAANSWKVKIVFIGDSCQLPPVDGGVASRLSPVFTDVMSKSVLTEVVRQAADNPIIALSMRIREAIEQQRRFTYLEAVEEAQRASEKELNNVACTHGGLEKCIRWVYQAQQKGIDARAICFTNNAVIKAGKAIHEMIYPDDELFAPGELAIVHNHFDLSKDSSKQGKEGTLITSMEVTVKGCEGAMHPYIQMLAEKAKEARAEMSPEEQESCSEIIAIKALSKFNPDFYRVSLEELPGEQSVYCVSDEGDYNKAISSIFQQAFVFKDADRDVYKKLISIAWTLKRAICCLRYSYAITAHKSQGSTFDCAVLNWQDMSQVKDDMDFNRLLYVGVTRPSKYLAFVA